MILTSDNYHSIEANRHYMSNTGFKEMLPQYGGCEACRMAYLAGEWDEKEESDSLFVGRYLHAWNQGNLSEFIELNSDKIYKSRGKGKYAHIEKADEMIFVLENDPKVQEAREGQKEVIMTAEMFGVPWKIMIDIYNPEKRRFLDLKSCESITKKYWSTEYNQWQSFIFHWGYDVQMAIYAEIERLANGRNDYFEPFIIAASKEKYPDHEIIFFGTDFITDVLYFVEEKMQRIGKVWKGEIEPIRCESCDYCRKTKKLKGTIFFMDIDIR